MSIQRIGSGDVHKITSGQVIVDLTTAVKEVVENSLDAGATQINIVFKNYGLDRITVSDNGAGITTDDFESICLKHYTSKLSNFDEVETVDTFGFRGEAMSSLCAIAKVSVVSAVKEEAPKAWSLKYNQMGVLESKELTSRGKGTTIEIDDLFYNLPVRKMDLSRNVKREYHRALDFLRCYALISVGVRFIVQHIDSRGKRSMMLSTTGSTQLRNNLLSVFGPNGLYGLEELDLTVEVPSRHHRDEMKIKVSGFVSNASFGQGRSSTDRQYWYVNGRPVNMARFSKAVNETYKKFNHLQYPMIVLNIEMDTKFVDVNVTPDKRTVLVNNEAAVLESLREEFYERFSSNDVKIPKNTEATSKISQRQVTLEGFGMRGENKEVEDDVSVIGSVVKSVPEVEAIDGGDGDDDNMTVEEDGEDAKEDTKEDTKDDTKDDTKEDTKEDHKEDPTEDVEVTEYEADNDEDVAVVDGSSDVEAIKDVADISHVQDEVHLSPCYHPTPPTSNSSLDLRPLSSVFSTLKLDQKVELAPSSLQLNSGKRRSLIERSNSKKQKVDNISDSATAEQLLTLTVSKSDFLEMKIVGQFNLGFILVSRKNESGKMDLFIVDQHASDEKYNFERFQEETTFKSQPLVIPQRLEMNAVDEMVVINSQRIFERNGFKLSVDLENEPGERIQLLALPYSRNTVFDLSDFHELVNLVRESDGNPDVRPSKVRAMFAMRACRSSIMIGKPLNKKTMETVVRHLSALDKPWNCPHGRPTMRHLVELQGWGAFADDC